MYLLIFVVFTIVASSYQNSFLKSIAEMWGCSKIPHCITKMCVCPTPVSMVCQTWTRILVCKIKWTFTRDRLVNSCSICFCSLLQILLVSLPFWTHLSPDLSRTLLSPGCENLTFPSIKPQLAELTDSISSLKWEYIRMILVYLPNYLLTDYCLLEGNTVCVSSTVKVPCYHT